MNPILQAALGSILRAGLGILAGYLVKAGIWSAGDAEGYVAAAALAILVFGWSMWVKYKDRVKFLTALTMPANTTENTVNAHIASGAATPSVLTPADTAPGVPK